MSGLFAKIETNNFQLKKKRLASGSRQFWREGFAQQLPTYDRSVTKSGEIRQLNGTRTETIRMPLKHAAFNVNEAIASGQAISGFGKNSLAHFVAALALAGFRHHEAAGEAKAAIYLARGGEAVFSSVADVLLSVTGSAGANHLIAFLTKPPRSANAEWNIDQLSKWLSNTFDKPASESGKKLVLDVAHFLLNAADGWSGVETPVTLELKACAILDALGVDVSPERLLGAIGALDDSKYLPLSWRCEFVSPVQIGDLESGSIELSLSHVASCVDADLIDGKPSDFYAKALGHFISKPSTYNSLSAILSLRSGLNYFSSTSTEAIASTFGVPEEHKASIATVCEIATTVCKNLNAAFGEPHECRQQVGAGLDSFAKIYFERLLEIRTQLLAIEPLLTSVSLPENMGDMSLDRLFWGMGISAATLQERWDAATTTVSHAIEMTNTLLGQKTSLTLHQSFIEDYSLALDSLRSLAASLRQVLNNHDSIMKDAEGAEVVGSASVAAALKVLHASIEFPEPLINALGFKSGKAKKAAFEQAQADDDAESLRMGTASFDILELPRLRFDYPDFSQTYQNMTSAFPKARDHAAKLQLVLLDGQSLVPKIMAYYRIQNARQYSVRGIEHDDTLLDIQCRRQFLQEFFGVWRQLSHEARSYAKTKLETLDIKLNPQVSWKKLSHEFMLEGKCAFYYKMYAKTRHQPIELDNQKLLALDFESLFVEMTDWLSNAAATFTYSKALVDKIGLDSRLLEMSARSVDTPVKASLLEIEKWPLDVTLRPAEQAFLSLERPLEPGEVARVIARIAVSLRDAVALCVREKHTGSITLKPTRNINSIHYFPKLLDADGKPRVWHVPARILHAKSGAVNVLTALASNNDGVLKESWAVGDLFSQLRAMIADKKTPAAQLQDVRLLLSEMPHSWGVSLGLSGIHFADGRSSDLPEIGLTVSKSDLAPFKNTADAPAFTLVSQVKYLNLLDEVLQGKRVIAPNNYTMHYFYQQHGADVVPVAHSVELHIALQTAASIEGDASNRDNPYFNRLVGIDLGERGIGFCVRDLSQPNTPVVERGFVPIPGIKNLIKATVRFRNKHQKEMSVKRSFVNFAEMRESVAGSVIHAIKSLMFHYKALPVLERDVTNLDKGSKQLSHVYTRVVAAFSFQNVSTQDDLRRHFWRGDQCIHPFLAIQFQEKSKKGTKVIQKPFHLFPGTLVHAAGTSQECSGCGVNASKLVKNSKQSQFITDSNGRIQIDDVVLQLFDVRSMNHVDESGIRAPYPMPADRKFSRDSLGTQIKQQRRCAPLGQSKDTTQSVFWCPNADCQHHHPDRLLHSDVNAADNVVMKKIKSLVPV